MLSSKINNCGTSKTKNIPFSNGMLYNELDKKLLFCSLRHRFQSFLFSNSFPNSWKTQFPGVFLRLLLNKLNFPTSSVSIVPCSTKTFLSRRGQVENENDCTWEECLAGTLDLVMSLALNRQKDQGWCPREQGVWGGLPHPTPIWHKNSLPYIRSVPILTRVSTKILGSGRSQETTAITFLASLNLLNHLPGGYSTFSYFIAWTLAIIKIILKALTEDWTKSLPQCLQQNHYVPKQFKLSSAFTFK